jgi:hypothetical protein
VIYAETEHPSGVGVDRDNLRPLRVKLSDPALVDDLVDFLSRCGCIAQAGDETTVLVSIPKSLREDAAERELDLYLRVWEAVHPHASATRTMR